MTEVLLSVDDVLNGTPGARQLVDGQSVLDLGWLGSAWCEDVVVRPQPPDGQVVEAMVVFAPDVPTTLADIGAARLSLAPDGEGLVRAFTRLTTGSSIGFALHDLPLAIVLEQPLLVRVDPITGEPSGDGLELVARAGIEVDAAHARVFVQGVDVPPFTISGTGLILALEDVQVDLDAATVTADRVLVRWLPQARHALDEPPGITLPFSDVFIEQEGVSFDLTGNWPVVERNGHLSPESAAFARLFDTTRIALAGASGRIERNQPHDLTLHGRIETPLFPEVLGATFALDAADGSISAGVAQDAGTPATWTLGPGTLTVENFVADGRLGEDSLSVSGGATCAITLPGLDVGPSDMTVSLATAPDGDELTIEFEDIGLGPLGRVGRAELHVARGVAEDGSPTTEAFSVTAELTFADIAGRLQQAGWPMNLPLPPDEATVRATIDWLPEIVLKLEADLDGWSGFFAPFPQPLRPSVRSVRFALIAEFADGQAFTSAAAAGPLPGHVFAQVEFRPWLPDVLVSNGIAELSTAGYVSVAVELDQGSLSMALLHAVEIDFHVPGLHGERSLLRCELERVAATLGTDGAGNPEAVLEMTGSATLRSPTLAAHGPVGAIVDAALAPLGREGLSGQVTAKVTVDDAGADLELEAKVDDANLELDVLSLLSASAPAGAARSAGGEIEFDTALAFTLDRLFFTLTRGAVDAEPTAEVGVELTARIGGFDVTASIRLSEDELVVGIDGATIPLRIPRFPVAAADLPPQPWSAAALNQSAASLGGSGGAVVEYVADLWRALPSAARPGFEQQSTAVIDALHQATGFTHVDSDLRLEVSGAAVRVPFADLAGVSVEGGAALTGFAQNDPLRGLDDLTLLLGLSSDRVYFSAEGSGEKIPLPTVGRYADGAIRLGHISIGYGFTRNSFAMAFEGALDLPPQLVADAETSRTIGFGVRLPEHSSLAFRLDVIPVPGPIPLVPTGEFSVDLRTPGLPGIAAGDGCRPVWDGLQLNVPGVIRADFKAAAASPLFGPLPIPNVRYDGDLELGTDQAGVRLVIDDLLVLFGIAAMSPPLILPQVVDPGAPYFEHLCLNIRMLGFGLNVDLERPFPQPDPLLVFDVMSFLAAPDQPLDPQGRLARLGRYTARDVSASIPSWARRVMPAAPEEIVVARDFELNVGTLIGAVQWTVAAATAGLDAAGTAIDNGAAAAPELDPTDLLDLLPPELRVIRTGIDLAGFRGEGAVALVDPRAQLPQAAPFDAFAARDLPARPARGTGGVFLHARLTVFETADFSLAGYLLTDGHFALSSRASVRPAKLRIAGIAVDLPLTLSGGATLSGQVSPRRTFGALAVDGHGRWEPIPGAVVLTVGTEKRPARVELSSEGRFGVSGDTVLSLFGGAIRMHGSVDASEAHLHVQGAMQAGIPDQLVLHPSGQALIGPGPRFAFDGRGEIELFGHTVAGAHVRATERSIRVEAQVSDASFSFAGVAVQLDAALAGEAALGPEGLPAFRLDGDGRITAGGAALEGRVNLGIGASSSFRAAGRLRWQGQDWVGGSIAIAANGNTTLEGRTSAVLDVTPSDLPAGIDVASLFLRVDLDGWLRLRPDRGLGAYNLGIDWSLGVRLPGSDEQMFVLAMQKRRFIGQAGLDRELVDVSALSLLPADVVIPVPTLKVKDWRNVYAVRLNILVVDQVDFLMNYGLAEAVKDLNLQKSRRKLFEVPVAFEAGVEDQTLGEVARAMAFKVSLAWVGDELGFTVRRGGGSTFAALTDLV